MKITLVKERLNTYFNKHYEKLKILLDLEVGDKPYYDNNEIKLDKNSLLQGFSRWYYAHNRNDFFNKFYKDLDKYYRFYKDFKNLKKDILLDHEKFVYFFDQVELVENFHTKFLSKLEILRKTYKEDKLIINDLILSISLLE